jgi:NADH:ubiquinone oxidoreductase subunit E
MTEKELDSVVEKIGATDAPALVGIMRGIQETEYCLPVRTLEKITEKLKVPMSRLYGLATFYKSFTLKPVGKHKIQICLGTACYIRGGPALIERVKSLLHVGLGSTTTDHKFTLNAVRCMGCCSIAPVVRIDSDTYGKVELEKVGGIIEKYE